MMFVDSPHERQRQAEAAQLDHDILALISAWRNGLPTTTEHLDRLFLATATHQRTYNRAYRAYVDTLELPDIETSDWRCIPAVPTSALKDALMTSFDVTHAAAHFQTSGTTMQRRGHHYMETTQLYDAAAAAIFERIVLEPLGLTARNIRIISIAPDARERPDSSLGHMIATYAREFSDQELLQFLHGDRIDVPGLTQAIAQARADRIPVCFIGTAVAFSELIEVLGTAGCALSERSFVIETGGFKTQNIIIHREEFYRSLARIFSLPTESIIAEFGMTELSSQYYDSPASRNDEQRVKIAPPWLRTRIVDAHGGDVGPGVIGSLWHYDLANRSSILGIETDDVALACDDGFVFIGRSRGAELRGCSVDAEHVCFLLHTINSDDKEST